MFSTHPPPHHGHALPPLPLPYPSSASSSAPYNHHPTPPYSQPMADPKPSQAPPPPPYLATPTSSYPPIHVSAAPAAAPSLLLPPQPQQQQHQQQHPHPHPHSHAPSLVINTKLVAPTNTGPDSSSMIPSPSSARKQQQQQSISQLSDFAAHMVCYLLYGHQSPSSHYSGYDSRVPSGPSSPLPSSSSSNSNSSHHGSHHGSHHSCSCPSCVESSHYHSHSRSGALSSAGSSSATSSAYAWPPQPQSQQPLNLNRPTHRRIVSESDIVQPKPLFRKFCLDVLSATLLSPSVILLSLKYIQKLMINLKNSNKIVNTGEGAEYRFFTGALILANKFLDDNTFTNKTWADITGMKIKDVNHLELQFLHGIDFRLFTSPAEYQEWLAGLTQFTSKYMPSQHHVAYHHQASAAQSPISPMDSGVSRPDSPSGYYAGSSSSQSHHVASSMTGHVHSNNGNSVSSSNGSSNTNTNTNTNSSSAYRQDNIPMSLSMASISQYIDAVKVVHHKSNARYQRVPASTSSSHSSQHQYQHQYSHQQYNLPLPPLHHPSQPSSQSLPHMHTSSPGLGYSGHGSQEPIQRKRSANIAFDEMMDRSPCIESGPVYAHAAGSGSNNISNGSNGSSNGSMRSSGLVPTHKRFSSSSSASALMGLGSGRDMYGVHQPTPPQLPPPQQERPHHHHHYSQQASSASQYYYDYAQQPPTTTLSHRASSGSMSTAYRGHHQRSASGSYLMDMAGYSSSPAHSTLQSHSSFSRSNTASVVALSHPVHPLDTQDLRPHYPMTSRSSYAAPPPPPASLPQLQSQAPQSSSLRPRPHSYHPATPPQYSSYRQPLPPQPQSQPPQPPQPPHHPHHQHHASCDTMGCGDVRMDGSACEIDPRLWEPMDSLSLYAMTTQAAKRVVAQSKALSALTNSLHMYYPATLA